MFLRWARWFAKSISPGFAALCGLCVGGAAHAVSCTITPTPVAFVGYDPTSTSAMTSTGYIDAHCTCSGIADCVVFSFTVSLAAGGSGSVSDRQMTSGSNVLHYNLYPSALSSTPWGSGASAQTVLYLLANFGSYQRLVVYGQIRAQQAVASGTYQDSTAITVTY